LLELDTIAVGTQDLEPLYRVYGPGVIGQLGAGLDHAFAYLPAAADYVVGVQNANTDFDKSMGGAMFTYSTQATIFPLASIPEVEPNDTEQQAQMLADPVTVVEGALATETDKDRTRVFVSAGGAIDAILLSGGGGRTVAIYQLGGNNPLVTGPGAIQSFLVPNVGNYLIEVSGPSAGPYVLLVRVQ
jgi:hypothetical protein